MSTTAPVTTPATDAPEAAPKPVVDPTTLWGADNGRIACENHLGGYATSIRREFPRRKVLRTPLDTWRRVTAEEAAYFEQEVGEPMSCESLRYGGCA